MEEENKGFDLRTHVRDPITARVVKHQPYQLRISKKWGSVYIRDGVAYCPNGELNEDYNKLLADERKALEAKKAKQAAKETPVKTVKRVAKSKRKSVEEEVADIQAELDAVEKKDE